MTALESTMGRYRTCAEYYDRGRLPYPSTLPDEVGRIVGRPPGARLLDVGCGTGAVTAMLEPLVDDAVGVDPDPGMIDVARSKARRDGSDTTFHVMSAEDLPARLGSFTMVTFALSFHWTDRSEVAAAVHELLRPGGWLILVSRSQPGRSPRLGALTSPPMDDVRRLVRSYIGDLTAHAAPDDDRLLASAGFTCQGRSDLAGGALIERTTDDIVAKVYSQADYAPRHFGQRLPDFERDLRSMLAAASPTGRFVERQPDCHLDVWRRG